jgi:hypothetical protein
MSASLPPALLKKIKTALLDLPYFADEKHLLSLMVDARICAWKDDFPSANTVKQRVDQTIGYFQLKETAEQQNGLALLLTILSEETPEGDKNRQILSELARQVQEIRHPSSAQLIPPVEYHLVDFVNRENELREIRSSTNLAQKYWVIDGPAGYGKTTFLEEVQKGFQEEGWASVLVTVDRKKPPDTYALALQISAQLEQPLAINGDTRPQTLGAHLAASLLNQTIRRRGRRQTLSQIHHKGVLLLLDNLEALDDETYANLADLLTGINNGLRHSGFYETHHNKFYAFLAGWEIRRRSNILSSRGLYTYTGLTLSPYTLQYIQQTVQNYAHKSGNNLPDLTITQIAARLMYCNGGHPRLIAKTLQELTDAHFATTPIWLSKPLQDEYHDLAPEIEQVLDSYGRDIPDLIPLLETLSVFRRFDLWLIRRLTEQKLLNWQDTPSQLQNKLTEAYLLKRESGMLQDGITQRLFNIRLRYQQKKRYEEICRQGIQLYQRRFSEEKTAHPIEWAVEHLYLSILYAHDVEQKHGDELKKLICGTIQTNARTLAKEWEESDPISDFFTALNADWELEFLVNFFLGGAPETSYTTLLEQARRDLA